jgi:DNA polymerase
MGVMLTPEQSALTVRVWRERYTRVVDYWGEIDAAARRCISTGREQQAGPIVFDRSGPFMRMRLPSGRCLHYCRPKIEPKRTPWGKVRPTITYEGLNDKNQWTRVSTHPGKLLENGDQAIARDVLAHGMMLAAREGLDIRLHVHDQIVAVVPEREAEAKLEVLRQCMSETPSWAPGLPLASSGLVSRVFLKD